jgi:hypothetical protein
MTDLFERRLRDAARAVPTPNAPDDLIQRVVAERSAGRRIDLPVGERNSSRHRGRRFSASAMIAIAASIVAVIALSWWRLASRAPLSPDDSLSSAGGFLVSAAFAGEMPNSSSIQPLSGVDGTRIIPRRYEYRIRYVDSTGRSTPGGGGSVTLSHANVGDVAAWRVILAGEQTDGGQLRTLSETLFVRRGDLAPLSRAVHIRPYRRYSEINIVQRFVGDSVLGEMTTDGGVRRPIARYLPPERGPYVSDAIALVALAGVPLSPGWSRAMSVPGWAVIPTDVLYPITLHVIGEERIETPTGVFDCWKVSVVVGQQRRIEWVRKTDGVALRSYDPVATPNGHRQYDLVNP